MLDQLLDNLIKAVSYTFSKDAIRPGVLISILRDGSIYSSVVRYGSGDGYKSGKKVVCKCTAATVEDAAKGLSSEFLKTIDSKPNPIDSLKELLK